MAHRTDRTRKTADKLAGSLPRTHDALRKKDNTKKTPPDSKKNKPFKRRKYIPYIYTCILPLVLGGFRSFIIVLYISVS